MSVVLGWIAFFLMAYFFIALFIVEKGAKKALTIASASGGVRVEAKAVLAQSSRARFLWVKRHAAQLPVEAHAIAKRAVAFEFSCWVTLVVLFIVYGLALVAP